MYQIQDLVSDLEEFWAFWQRQVSTQHQSMDKT